MSQAGKLLKGYETKHTLYHVQGLSTIGAANMRPRMLEANLRALCNQPEEVLDVTLEQLMEYRSASMCSVACLHMLTSNTITTLVGCKIHAFQTMSIV